MLHRIAWQIHQQTGVDVEELFSEACLAYCERRWRYNKKRGRFSTFLNTVVPNWIKGYLYENIYKLPTVHRHVPDQSTYNDGEAMIDLPHISIFSEPPQRPRPNNTERFVMNAF